ncbi:DUF6152 family protein [Larkinella soli]|uniref:DUF6152 family protein n=1 Tax=Larkinella soli TaxID=1770527 RepID=UPI000FFC2F3C|nr:DUF6152 family protein [Larkinella soli]
MKTLKFGAAALLLTLGTAFTVLHHGWSNYDQNIVLDYTGTIESSKYENPHATARLKDKDKTWTVVLAPTTRMQDRGVTPEMIRAGASVRVVGYPHKQIKDEMRVERIFIDGQKYELR